MIESERTHGFAVLCDLAGVVIEVPFCDLTLGVPLGPGVPLRGLVDEGSLGKLEEFLACLHSRRAALDWEINVWVDGAPLAMHFAGAVAGEQVLVTAASTRTGLTRINEELMRLNNEGINALRSISKELVQFSTSKMEIEGRLYDELSRLNNELANLQREMVKKNIELERLNDLKNQFMGMAAHDIRNPVGVIMTYSQVLEEDAAPVLTETQLEFIHIIRETSSFIITLINDLLDVTQIEAGKLRLDRKPVDLAALVRHNVMLNRKLAARKRIEIELAELAWPPLMSLDASKMDQVLNNLIANAIKFSHAGTRVTVSLDVLGDTAKLIVRDQGQGIPKDDLAKLFKPFSRTSVQSTAGEPSSGLGLAIVAKIVHGHGGEIRVESEVGVGSAFIVTLPICG